MLGFAYLKDNFGLSGANELEAGESRGRETSSEAPMVTGREVA